MSAQVGPCLHKQRASTEHPVHSPTPKSQAPSTHTHTYTHVRTHARRQAEWDSPEALAPRVQEAKERHYKQLTAGG